MWTAGTRFLTFIVHPQGKKSRPPRMGHCTSVRTQQHPRQSCTDHSIRLGGSQRSPIGHGGPHDWMETRMHTFPWHRLRSRTVIMVLTRPSRCSMSCITVFFDGRRWGLSKLPPVPCISSVCEACDHELLAKPNERALPKR
ncbi:hypothetical protein PsorP6_000892 [Peronosclerospora sorghi]|uniref:Uncharacterized protein n=1 Tax=Peronosclerospora sorghi TaxID=230839 RepID=A0ACC0WX64_9STRA|nr:hypothetical protein PsorP6_000892 [Peronosclerospora sorghi]